MSVPHGFKAKANRIAVGVRHQIGLKPEAPIDLRALATHLHLTLVPITDFGSTCPRQVTQLVEKDSRAFSALLLPIGSGRKIVLYNDRNSEGRFNSDIAHEISHVLLAHPPASPFDDSGCRAFDKDIEHEANCLSGYILIPDEAARKIVKCGLPQHYACGEYGVSREMLEFRLNSSGARIWHRRLRKFRGSE